MCICVFVLSCIRASVSTCDYRPMYLVVYLCIFDPAYLCNRVPGRCTSVQLCIGVSILLCVSISTYVQPWRSSSHLPCLLEHEYKQACPSCILFVLLSRGGKVSLPFLSIWKIYTKVSLPFALRARLITLFSCECVLMTVKSAQVSWNFARGACKGLNLNAMVDGWT